MLSLKPSLAVSAAASASASASASQTSVCISCFNGLEMFLINQINIVENFKCKDFVSEILGGMLLCNVQFIFVNEVHARYFSD